MKAWNKIILTLVFLLFAILVLVQHYMPKAISWEMTFTSHSKSPYACRIMKDMLTEIFPGCNISVNNDNLYNISEIDTAAKHNLIIISNEFNPDEATQSALLDFVARGNTVFLSALSFPSLLSDTLHLELYSPIIDTSWLSKQKFVLRLIELANDTFSESVFSRRMPTSYFTRYDTLSTVKLGTDREGKPNFIVTSFGRGTIFLHSQPLAFSNYHLLYSDYRYACKSLSFLPLSNVIWDEYYKPGRMINLSPVRYILSQPSLRSGYYLMMAVLLIYFIFGSKRKQRAIPVVKPEENASLKFLITVGRLYFRRHDHADLANKKIMYFHEFIRNRYYIHDTSDGEENIRLLALKSGVDKEVVTNLIHKTNAVFKQQELGRNELVELHRLLDNFYKHCN